MASAKDIKNRISSVTSTHKITRTMEMVATSKFKRFADRAGAAMPFSNALPGMLALLASAEDDASQPLLERRPEVRRVAVLLLTTNRGLCGPMNSNLLKKAMTFRGELLKKDIELDLHVVGKKGISYLRFLGVEMASEKNDLPDAPEPEHAEEFADMLVQDFLDERVDEVYIAYPHFKNAAEQPPVVERILPLVAPETAENEDKEEDDIQLNFIFEPGKDDLLGELLPLYLRNSFFRILLEAAASEQGARRTAMKAATDSAEEMLTDLTRSYNKARQAAITTELLEIVGGAEALK